MDRTKRPALPPSLREVPRVLPGRPVFRFLPPLLLLFLLCLPVPPVLPAPAALAAPDPAAAAPEGSLDLAFGVPEAKRALARYLSTVDEREFEVDAEPLPLLRKVLLGRARLKDAPFEGPRYLVHANGRVEPYTLDALVAAFREESDEVTGGRDGREGAGPREISAAIAAGDRPGAVLLQGQSDIPAYCRRPLELDLSSVLRPPWFYEDEGATFWVLYTWHPEGGVVDRYRFAFRGKRPIPTVSVLRIGERVGDYNIVR